jgi:hypothetical protein
MHPESPEVISRATEAAEAEETNIKMRLARFCASLFCCNKMKTAAIVMTAAELVFNRSF